jgi:hypothetical protein
MIIPPLAQIAELTPTAAPVAEPAGSSGPAGFLSVLLVLALAVAVAFVWRNPTHRFVPERIQPRLLKKGQAELFDQVRRQMNDQISRGDHVTLPDVVVVRAPDALLRRMRTSHQAVVADLAADIENAYDFTYDDNAAFVRPEVWLEGDTTPRRLEATVYFVGQERPERAAARAGRTVTATVLGRTTVEAHADDTGDPPTPDYRPDPPTPDYGPDTPTPDHGAVPLHIRRLRDAADLTITTTTTGGRGTAAGLRFSDATLLSREAFKVRPTASGWTVEVLPGAKHGIEVNGASMNVGRPVDLTSGDRIGVKGYEFAEVISCSR